MASVSVSIGSSYQNQLKSPIKEGDLVWLKFKKNKSRKVLAYARKIQTHDNEYVIAISRATRKERDNYKSIKLIKRLK